MKKPFFEIIPSGTNFDFVGRRRRYVGVSLLLILLSFLALAIGQVRNGSVLNFGIDFEGGSQVRVALTKELAVDDLRAAVDEFGYDGGSVVRVPDAENEIMVRVKEVVTISQEEGAACQAALEQQLEGARLREHGFDHADGSSKIFLKFDAQVFNADIDRILNAAGCRGTASPGYGKAEDFPVEYALVGIGPELVDQLDGKFGAGTVDHIVASETVGAKVGEALKVDGARALLFALGFIFLYVMIRFDLRFAPGGIVALIHDVIITVGMFAVTGKEFNLQTIAALLTIVGYSINDTIVVFDRVRERVALHRDEDIETTTNKALNETLSRTILTSGTTLLVVVATWVLGSGPIKDFAFALLIGIVVGTYSSIFIATPVFLWVNKRFYAGKGHLLNIHREEREGTGTLLGAAASAGRGGAEDDAPPVVDAEKEVADDDEEPEEDPGGEKKASRRRRRRPK